MLFGLYHGLIFLPVILSILGPDPYPNAFENGTEYHFDEKGKNVEMQAISTRSLKFDQHYSHRENDSHNDEEAIPVHDPLIIEQST